MRTWEPPNKYLVFSLCVLQLSALKSVMNFEIPTSRFVCILDFSLSRGMGMEVCCTLGMLEQKQAEQLKAAGLTAYNHNLDTSREYYPNIITTRSYDERLKTLEFVRDAGISVCSGTISRIFSLFTSLFRH